MQGAVVHFVNLGSGPKTEAMRRSQALLAHRAFADVTTEIASIILHCNGSFGAEAGFSPQPRPSRSANGRSRRRPEVNRSGCGRPVQRRRVGRGLRVGESGLLVDICGRDRCDTVKLDIVFELLLFCSCCAAHYQHLPNFVGKPYRNG